jgi:transposase InsO family protein
MNIEVSNHKIIKNRIGLLNLAKELGNVSRACKVMGYSRDTFYRYKSAKEEGGIEALFDANRRKPNLKNRVDEKTEQHALQVAFDFPAFGQARASNELRKHGIFISPAGVRCIWLRNNLETFKKRLKNLEERMAKETFILTESQVRALEQKKHDDLASGEIETAHPGYLGSQDTFYVGTIKGVGRIYQQTFVDTYSKVACAKLYTTKTPITAADLLNDKVIPLFEAQEIPLLRILTDRGTEYCGKHDSHDYQLYLGLNDIEHSKTKVKSPQQNGICERFHKTTLQEFYQVAFRKTIYRQVDELQIDLDKWLKWYNEERTHQGKMCCGRTPLQTLLDGKEIVRQKIANLNLPN